MSSISQSRPPRRASTRKRLIVQESSEDELQSGRATPTFSAEDDDDNNDEEYTPVPNRTAARRTSRRQAAESIAESSQSTVQPPRKTRRTQTRESLVTSNPFSGVEASAIIGDPESPTRRQSVSRSRHSTAHRSTRMSSVTPRVEFSSIPTPAPSQSPEPSSHRSRRSTSRSIEPTPSSARHSIPPEPIQQAETTRRSSRRSTSQHVEPRRSSTRHSLTPAPMQPEQTDGQLSRRSSSRQIESTPSSERHSATPTPTQFTETGRRLSRRSITREAPQQEPSSANPAAVPSIEHDPASSEREATPTDSVQHPTDEIPLQRALPEASNIEAINPMSTALEKPIDILMKSRAMSQPPTEEPLGPKPRMVITHLVLTNFKSYAGRQVVGPFHASFSSVVGPNGSGKSNVIDSLLFVFGFRASKMRQGKISALIHNSANFPNLPFCEVEVHFQEVLDLPGGGHEIVENSQLVVSRRAFKNNTSKYYMNRKETNFTTVTDFLRARGIDLDHKRFLILQGEVESIAQMKPKAANDHDDGLLEYLEDIIGTSKYKVPIEEAAAEVETLNEVCSEKSSRVQHVEKEKSSLEDKKNKALVFIKDENELVEKQSALYQIYIDECNDNTRVTEEAILQMQELLNLELEKHQGNEEGIKDLQRQFKRSTKEHEAMEKETQAIAKEMSKYDKESVKLEEKRKFLANKRKKLEKAMQASRLAASECASLVEKHADDVERKTAEIASLEKEMRREEEELASIRESLKGKTQGLSDQIAAMQKGLEPWNEKINEKLSAMAVAQSELDILHEKSNAGAVALEEAQAKIASIQEGGAAKTHELEQRRLELTELENEVATLTAELQRFSDKEPEYRSRLSRARQNAEEARSSLTSTQNQGNVLAGLMRLKESGRIQGFHGRLGNLGTIEEKFDVAISTACPALDNLVVDSVEVGQQCIEYLRKNNLGRANFILLDRLPRRDMSPIFTPDSVPRLFDLVKPVDPKFSPAFYSVMQNTLVAKDLEQANKIAYGARRWRVVTLDGQLIDVSGTMSGGGTRVARGAMSSKRVAEVSKDQVEKLDAERDHMEKRFQAFQEKQRQLESSLKSKNDDIPKLNTTIQKLQLEIESAGRNLADAKRRVKELTAEHKPSKDDDSRAAALRKHISLLEAEIDQLRAEKAGVEEEIQTLQNKIMEIGGVRLRGQKAKVDGLKEQISLLTEEVSSAEVSKSKNAKLRVKHEKSRVDSEGELEQLAEELDRLSQENEDQANIVSEMRERTEAAQEALLSKKEELAGLKAELNEKTAELNETRAVEIEMRNKLEENQKVLVENQKRCRYWEEKLSKLSLQNISDLGEEQESDQLPVYTKDELSGMNKESLKAVIAALEEKTQNAQVDLSVLAEYRRRVAEHESRSADLASALASRDNAKSRLDTLRSLRLTGFMEGFSTISLRLKEMYQMITMGGNAELELVDSLDPFSEGILFSVMPPKKSWKNISNLSGGEKTLSSLALVFALHHYKPTPLYVMDEIDAALDFRNVSIVASYIKERTKNAQFIVISLRNNMFELAARLVGVYKVNHMTKSVTVENKDYIAKKA
ncbi:nuclear condensin complex subunit Smc4 [Coccidioides immitis RS]|uniref:Structural maintenance of chromosomes protein 4 n=1 Tax=Coccidioides immitis (strain RS) TaxID=246410 RepID=J3KFR7_COCIM|nr:nuclear condensin complex subunit Smc4 [Coccidioides immitis RS]EAS34494.3 nuclear condensin complex subunit Smc4 [Coccidioides immitis RS]